MDVSQIRAGSSWEIEQMIRRDLVGRCLFVVHEGHETDARMGLEQLLPTGSAMTVHIFTFNGEFRDAPKFLAEIARRLASA
jgi:hypothetical protein